MSKSLSRAAQKMRAAIRRGDLWAQLRLWRDKYVPLFRIVNPKIRSAQLQDQAYRMLVKKYQPMVDAAPPADPNAPAKAQAVPKIIWWCWLQGVENAPEIVQTCLESVRRHLSDYDLRIITLENYAQYVEIPDYIVEKYLRGSMSANHFANVLRLELLVRYGGLWLDATVLCTGREMMDVLNESDLFVYYIFDDLNLAFASNWFISAKPDNDILRLTLELHHAYWREHRLAPHYFFFHTFFKMAALHYPEQWRALRRYVKGPTGVLLREMDAPYSQARYAEICKMTPFHKLNWKFKIEGKPGSMYDVVIRQRKY